MTADTIDATDKPTAGALGKLHSTWKERTEKATAARKAAAKLPLAQRPGVGARLRRGLPALPGAFEAWRMATEADDAVDAAVEKGDAKTIILAKRERAKVRTWRHALLWMLFLVGAGGWWKATVVAGIVALIALALAAALEAVTKEMAAALIVSFVVGLFVLILRAATGWSLAWFTLSVVAGVAAWCVKACWDGDPSNDFGTEVERADVVKTDTRYNRIVEGLTVKLGIKPDDPQIKVIGAGLEPVDNLWSKMRIQTPGTISNKQIQDAMVGVAAFMGISVERLDAVPVDDGHGGEIEGVVDIWLASGDQWKTAPAWPLLEVERTSVWEPAPFIITDRGASILVNLLFAIWMFVAKPRHGKTFAMRLLAFVAAKDPSCDYATFDFKMGGRDWLWAQRTAIASGYGPSDATIEAYLEFLQSVIERSKQMGELFQKVPLEVAPHGQLTKEACRHDPRLRPLLIFVDEVHHALTHEKYGKDVAKLMSKIGRELPFLGINLMFASQRADVRTSIPSEVRSLAANRVAGKLYTSRDSGDVLGDAANELGYNAKNLRPVKGLFIVHGADDTSSFDGYTKGRSYLVDNVQAEQIGQQAFELRKAAGVLPDQGGDGGEEPPPDELVQAIGILRAAEVVSMRSEELAAQMGTTPQRLIARIGVSSKYNYDDGKCKHLYLADLEAAANGERPGLRVVS